AELGGVFLRRKISSTPPRFVTHAPETNPERLWVSIGRPLLGQRGLGGRRIAVLDPFVKISRCIAADIGRQIWLRANELAKTHKFIGPELVRLIFCRPVRRR